MTETREVSSADMTWPPNPQNSAETAKPMNNRVPVISRKHSSLFLPLTSHMQACAICSYAKVCKIVQVEGSSGACGPPRPPRRVRSRLGQPEQPGLPESEGKRASRLLGVGAF